MMNVTHRGRTWQATATEDAERPYVLRSGEVEVALVRLNKGRPEELTPMIGTRQQTVRYGLFSDESGALRGLDP